MVYVPGDVVSEASPTIDCTHPVGSCDLSHDLWKTDDVVQFWTPFQPPSGPRSTTGQSEEERTLLVFGCQCFDGCDFLLWCEDVRCGYQGRERIGRCVMCKDAPPEMVDTLLSPCEERERLQEFSTIIKKIALLTYRTRLSLVIGLSTLHRKA